MLEFLLLMAFSYSFFAIFLFFFASLTDLLNLSFVIVYFPILLFAAFSMWLMICLWNSVAFVVFTGFCDSLMVNSSSYSFQLVFLFILQFVLFSSLPCLYLHGRFLSHNYLSFRTIKETIFVVGFYFLYKCILLRSYRVFGDEDGDEANWRFGFRKGGGGVWRNF